MSTESNLKESLKNSRVLCPGLCEIDYTVADALSEAIIDCELPPSALVQNLALVFARPDDNHPVEDDGVFIPQIIDAIASKEFADEFRNLCKDVFDWDTTQRFNVTTSGYEDKPHIKFAADWWTGRIQRQTTTTTLLSGEKGPRQSLVRFTPEMISQFHACLASEIEKEIGWNVYHTSRQKTRYWTPVTPSLILAADSIGIEYDANPYGVFPSDITMDISEDAVVVDGKILWQKDK